MRALTDKSSNPVAFWFLFIFSFGVLFVSALDVRPCPHLALPPNSWSAWSNTTLIERFEADSSPTVQPAMQTSIHLCHTEAALILLYRVQSKNIWSKFSQCNEPLYEENAVEAFLAVKSSTGIARKYLEVEIAPTSALFVSLIENPDGVCKGIEGTPVPCPASGIDARAFTHSEEGLWLSYASIPLNLIAQASGVTEPSRNLTGNFFRIDTSRNLSKEWSCWRSTESVPACFHKPAYFGDLILV